MLYWQTVNELLTGTLQTLMQEPLFDNFRLVGGTALSLQIGHRESVDIDLFTDASYRSIDFDEIERYFLGKFPFLNGDIGGLPGFGKSYLVGENLDNHVKVDVYYSQEPFIRPVIIVDGIRLASIDDIVAMKVDVISRGGRRKDFWDLHELMEKYSLERMLALHEERHPYAHDEPKIIANFTDFERADEDFDPICYRGKHWEFIKDDFIAFIAAGK